MSADISIYFENETERFMAPAGSSIDCMIQAIQGYECGSCPNPIPVQITRFNIKRVLPWPDDEQEECYGRHPSDGPFSYRALYRRMVDTVMADGKVWARSM